MKIRFSLFQEHIAYTLLISICLQSCGGSFDNKPLIASGEKEVISSQPNAQTMLVPADTQPLIDQTLIAQGGHRVTFYNYKDKLWASVAIAGEKNKEYHALHAEIQRGTELASLLHLTPYNQKKHVHIEFIEKKEPFKVTIYKGAGLMGGMQVGDEEAEATEDQLEDDSIPHECFCPITQEVMKDPVIAQDGHTYERSAIERWFATGQRTSPVTRAVFSNITLRPNYALRNLIQDLVPNLAKRKLDMHHIEAAIKLREEEVEQTLAEKGQLLEKQGQEKLHLAAALEQKEKELVENKRLIGLMDDRIKQLERQVSFFLERDKKLLGLIQTQPFAVPSLGAQPSSASSSTSSCFVPQSRQGLEEATPLEEQDLPVAAAKRRKIVRAQGVDRGNLREEKGKEKLRDNEEMEAEEEESNQHTEQASIETQELYGKAAKEEEQKLRNCINILLSSILGITGRDDQGNTVLHLAIQQADTFLSERLKELKTYMRDCDRSSLEYLAARFIRKAYVPVISKLVLKAPHLIIAKNRNGYTPLLLAAFNGQLELVQFLLANGASLEEKINRGDTALLLAAVSGQLDTVKWLLANGASLQEKNNRGDTALLFAAASGKLDTVKWLVANGANLQEKNNNGTTALLVAAANGHLDTVKWLLANGASLQEKENRGDTALLVAAANGHLDIVNWLLANGASLQEKNDRGDTALLVAAANGHLDTVKWLLANGASLQEKNNRGRTALLFPVLSGHLDTVKWLLANGASLKEKTNNGDTALLGAAYSGQLDTVKWLLVNGASLKEKTNNGDTALLLAAAGGQLDTVKWLLANGVSLQEKNNNGTTALLYAAASGHLDTVKWLLANGANKEEKDKCGHKAIDRARMKGHQAIVNILG
jgi:ankyrin repeat protein